MKKFLSMLALLPIALMAVEYEFLTPQVLVLKNPKTYTKSSHAAAQQGCWQKENALARDKKGNILRKADITNFEYIVFAEPLKNGEKVSIAGTVAKYDSAVPSNIFKLNQVGNGADQKSKYAYMGAWLGSLGALPLKHFAGKEFEIKKSSDNQSVYKNTLKLRGFDPLYQGKIPFTGEEVLELDYSKFNTPGKYYFYVENIGRSMDFVIGSEALNEAFYIHARGLYHKRCGIAKTQPFTAWVSPECHQTVLRGRFPGNAEHYRKGKGGKDCGFFDIKDNRIEAKVFDLIKDNPPYKKEIIIAPGGWHDAADYDRRPYHLRIVSDLATVYLMKPENFTDGQLNIPESGNKIPDILDEAAWGVKHLLAVQQSDGGVGTWFETVGHPIAGEGLPHLEKRTYYVSKASCNITLEYAAAVSTLALALKKAGAGKDVEKYIVSAKKAWDFAINRNNRHIAWLRLKNKLISYREEPFLYGENLLKAGLNLYVLTGERRYIEPVLEDQKRIKDSFNKDFWKWSQLSWMVLELYPVKELESICNEYRKVILHDADRMLAEHENAYPYRTLWHAHNAGWVHSMAWGNYHPLRRAKTLIAAHKRTGKAENLAGAY
ncbi:MAG: glycoside hydrolase family 9 protein [Lentisphaeria bacterium]|nr:glycoside hydrolase family 9 protein [Lentisphaeria bacterium]